MAHIAIISGSVRTGRNSHRVAQFLHNFIETNNFGSSEILDLNEYNFPLFNERLKYQTDPSPAALDFSERIRKADGVIIVTPEYNGGYPASVKNAVDLLYDEWQRKPLAISTVSSGDFAGSQVITSLQFTMWKIRATVVTAMLPVARVQESFNEDGLPLSPETMNKRAAAFIKELLHTISANKS